MKKLLNIFFLIEVITSLVLAACSDDKMANSNGKQESAGPKKGQVHLVVQPNPWATKPISRVTLTEKTSSSDGSYLSATWNLNDMVYVYNVTTPSNNDESLVADEDAANSTFSGYVTCVVGDSIALFYPYVTQSGLPTGVYDSYNGKLTLNITGQDGSLERIQKRYDFCAGRAYVSKMSGFNAVATYDTLQNLMAVVRFVFICDNETIKNIKSVKVTDTKNLYLQKKYDLDNGCFCNDTLDATDLVIPPAGITFNFRENDSTPSTTYTYYQVFFPGPIAPQFTVTTEEGNIYTGNLLGALKAGRFYVSKVYCSSNSRTGNIRTVSDRVGQKWAFGNLYYREGKFQTFADYQFSKLYWPDEFENGSAAINGQKYLISTDLFNFGDIGTVLSDGTLGFYNYNTEASTYYLSSKYESATYYNNGSEYTSVMNMGICGDKRYDICTRALGASWRLPSYYEVVRTRSFCGMGYGYNQYFYSTSENQVAGDWDAGLFLGPHGIRDGSTYSQNSNSTIPTTGVSARQYSSFGWDPDSPYVDFGYTHGYWGDWYWTNPRDGQSYNLSSDNIGWYWWAHRGHWYHGYGRAEGYYMTGSINDANNFWVLHFWWDSSNAVTTVNRSRGVSVRCRYIED
ncbi:MAG: hypothetical protein IKR18_11305 [Bacteroidaceae bacterium]|nr:hypothetical protein [Bacteroidaceae bacterium]